MKHDVKRRRVRRKVVLAGAILAVLLTANYIRPLPAVRPQPQPIGQSIAASTATIPWPAYGQAALATPEDGLVASTPGQQPLATASIAKVITALCVLQKYPLNENETGPIYTINATDVALYQRYAAQNGSLTPVQLGEQLTERQLLQAMMIPSANNLADTAAVWAFGSLDAYHTYANAFVRGQGMTQTTVADDASGFSSATVSTADDLVKLGLLAIKQPALRQIMNQKTAVLPVAGTVTNYNQLLGTSGIFGIKTGNNDTNLGALLFASSHTVNGTEHDIVGAVMGADSLGQAFTGTTALTLTAQQLQRSVTIASREQPVVRYTSAWGATAAGKPERDVTATYWQTNAVTVTPDYRTVYPGQTGSVGSIQLKTAQRTETTAVKLDQPLAGPSFWWRLTRF